MTNSITHDSFELAFPYESQISKIIVIDTVSLCPFPSRPFEERKLVQCMIRLMKDNSRSSPHPRGAWLHGRAVLGRGGAAGKEGLCRKASELMFWVYGGLGTGELGRLRDA